MQIHIKSIHVRYEDGSSTPEHPFAAGLTIDEFKAVSTDERWIEAFIQDSLKGVHKVCVATNLYLPANVGAAGQTRCYGGIF